MSAGAAAAAELRAVDLLAGLDDAALARWAACAVAHDVAAGEVLAEQGERPPGLLLIVDGVIETLEADATGVEGVDRHRAPTWMGAVALLTGAPMPVRVRALTPCRVLVVGAEDVRVLLHEHPAVFGRVMARVAPVYARVATVEATRARLAAMTRLAAGLAHELNNPASAMRRAAQDLDAAVTGAAALAAVVADAAVGGDAGRRLLALQAELLARAPAGDGTLEASDREEDLLAALGTLGVPEPWLLAVPLAAAGADEPWVRAVAAAAGPRTTAALRALAARVAARDLTAELHAAAVQVGDLVDAAKGYALLDRDPHERVDVHDGLEATLTVLARRLDGIAVRRDYDRSAPPVAGDGAALNQVWSTLLDNAADAAGPGGTVTVVTRRRPGAVLVSVVDDGPGIAPEHQARVFDPFFTTKPVGAGRGLGLTTAHRIVVGGHGGSLTVDSRPGRTALTVRLPLPDPRGPRSVT